MFLRIWRGITLMLTALSLTMTSAHVLELPQKMKYDAQMYAAVNTTLYRYFAIVGGFYTITSILAAAMLAFLVRKRKSAFRWTLAAAVCTSAGLGAWFLLVAPMNAALSGWTPETLPGDWAGYRDRWEAGHAIHAVFFALGFGALVVAILSETSEEA